jgi:hypothetical protein
VRIQIDKFLQQYLDQGSNRARLRRDGGNRDRKAVLAEILAELESSGDAMRYVNGKGRIAWKATPQVQSFLADLQADAEADAEEEAL